MARNKKEFDPTNRASTWVNENYLENDSQPVLRIKMNVDGEDKELSLFLNDRHDAFDEAAEILAELIEVVAESESRSPIFTGKVQLPYAQRKESGSGGRRKAKSRSRTSKSEEAEAEEQTEDSDNW
jgi:hypothetical protein